MEGGFTAVAMTSDLAPGQTRCIELDGERILLARLEQGWVAVENRCSHAGASLAGPVVRRFQIACPLHGARFDLRTGDALSAPAYRGLKTYRVRIADGKVEIALPGVEARRYA